MKQEPDLAAELMASIDQGLAKSETSAPTTQGLLPNAIEEELDVRRQEQESFRHELQACLRWSLSEGRLPGDYGSYRISIPYFALELGSSFAFLQLTSQDQQFVLKSTGRGHFFVPEGGITVGWKSMIGPYTRLFHRRELQQYANLSSQIEIDFDDSAAAAVSANRWSVELSSKGVGSVQWSKDEAHRLHLRFLEENHSPVYVAVSGRVGSTMLADAVPKYWLGKEQSEKQLWQPLAFPLVASSNRFNTKELAKLRFRGEPLHSAPEITAAFSHKTLYWHSLWLAPDRGVERPYPARLGFEALWTESPTSFRPLHPAGLRTSFPPEWLKVVGGAREHYSAPGETAFLWNRDHMIVNQVDGPGWQKCRDSFALNLNPLAHRSDLLSQRNFSASWLLKCLMTNAEVLWNGLIEKESALLLDLWAQIFGAGMENDLVYLPNLAYSSKILLVGPYQWKVLSDYDEQRLHLPEPSVDWRLEFETQPSE